MITLPNPTRGICVEPAWETIKAVLLVSSLVALLIFCAIVNDRLSPDVTRADASPKTSAAAVAEGVPAHADLAPAAVPDHKDL